MDCAHLGLNRAQRAILTGFTWRTVCALAHLRDAWAMADLPNAHAVEEATRALLASHSLKDIPGICAAVLTHGLDDHQGARLIARVGLPRPEKQEGPAGV